MRTALGLVSLCLLAVLCTPLRAQVTFQRTYGGPGHDDGYSVVWTADGGCAIAGRTESFGAGQSDVWLVKVDACGDTLWTRTYGGPDMDAGLSLQQTSDNGYIIAGYTYSFGAGISDAWLIKTDAHGDTLWTRTFGGPDNDMAWSVQQTADGGYIVAGNTEDFHHILLVRNDNSGNTRWTRSFEVPDGAWGNAVRQTFDGGFVVAGGTQTTERSFCLVKTDSDGNPQWSRTYGSSGLNEAWSVQQTGDSGFAVTGERVTNLHAAWLIRTDALGETLWTRTYGGLVWERAHSLQQTVDGGFIMAGDSAGCVWLIKTNSLGAVSWTRSFAGYEIAEGWSVQQTDDGGYVVAGATAVRGDRPDVILIKTDSLGNVGVADHESTAARDANPATLVRGVLHLWPSPFPLPQGEGQGVREQAELLDISGRSVLALNAGANDVSRLSPGVYLIRRDTGYGLRDTVLHKVIVTR